MVHYLSHTEELVRACKKFNRLITVDTEFIAGPLSYYPKLCLIQLFDGVDTYIVDVLSEKMDISPLYDIFNDNNIVKVFHSSFVDLQIFTQVYGIEVRGLVDSQIAYSFLTGAPAISYGKFIEKYLGVHLDKSLQVSDWDKRPLTAEQKVYASADVTYLYKASQMLLGELKEAGRKYDWFVEEMKNLEQREHYVPDVDNAYRRIKIGSKAPVVIAKAKELAKLREIEAIKSNKSVQSVFSDSNLIKIAFGRSVDKTIAHGISSSELRKLVSDVIKRVNSLSIDEINKLIGAQSSKKTKKIANKIQEIINRVSGKYKINPNIVCLKRDVQELSVYPENRNNNILFRGWRKEMVGGEIEKFLNSIQGNCDTR